MNRCVFGRKDVRILVGLVVLGLGGRAWGLIPDTVKKSDDMSASAATITEDIKKTVARLAAGATDAREELFKDALVQGQTRDGLSTASPAYLDALTKALGAELIPLAKNPSLSVRLNAAIVAGRVALVANNVHLGDALVAFAGDKSDPVVLWAVRGARGVVPNLLKGPFANPKHALIPAVVDAVKNHSEGLAAGWIASDAYDALVLDVVNPANRKKLTPDTIRSTIDPVQNLLAVRVDQYKRAVPGNTAADRAGTSFLVNDVVWTVQTPQQQVRTMQLLSDLLSLAAQQAMAQHKNNNANDVGDLAITVSQTAKAISVAASAAGETKLKDAVTPAANTQKATPVNQIEENVNAVHPAIKESAKFKTVTEPPKIEGTKAAPMPTTAPETLPGMTTPPPPPPPPPPQPAPGPGGAAPPPGGRPPPVQR